MISTAAESGLWIETPEGISFSYEIASPILRMYSLLLDGFCVYGLSMVVWYFASGLNLILENVGTSFAILGFFLLTTGYYILTEWYFQGQSVGKKLLGLRVMDARGFRLRFDQIVLRNILRAVDILPLAYLFGGLTAFFSSRHQRLGDMLGGTVVVRERRLIRPDVTNLLGDKYNSFLEHPHLIYRARSRINPEEAGLLLNAVLRRDQLDPDARLSVYAALAAYFKAKVPFPDEALSDERYLRNYAYTLFNR